MHVADDVQLVDSWIFYVENGSEDAFDMEPYLFVMVQYEPLPNASHVKFDLIIRWH